MTALEGEYSLLYRYKIQVLFVLFGLYVAFNILAVISRRCLDVAGSSMLTFRVLPYWNTTPQALDMIFHPVTLYRHWANQFWFLALQAKEQLMPFLKSLGWLGRGSKPQPPGHKANTLPTEHLCRKIREKHKHWAGTQHFPQDCMSVLRRLRSGCASAHADLSLRRAFCGKHRIKASSNGQRRLSVESSLGAPAYLYYSIHPKSQTTSKLDSFNVRWMLVFPDSKRYNFISVLFHAMTLTLFAVC